FYYRDCMKYIFPILFTLLLLPSLGIAQYIFHYQVRMEDKVGLFTGDGQEVLPIQYDSLIPLIHQTMLVQQGDKWGMANGKNPNLIRPKYPLINGHSRYAAFQYDSVVVAYDGTKYICFDYEGNKLTKFKVDKMSLFYEGVSKVQSQGETYYMDLEGKRVDYTFTKTWMGNPFTFVGEPKTSGMMTEADDLREYEVRKENGKWGIRSFNGTWKVAPQFSYMKELFLYNGSYFSVAKAPARTPLGVIDLKGQEVLPLVYQSIQISSFKKQVYFSVQKGDKWGMVDLQNQVKIPIEYDQLSGYGAYRIVKKNGKKGLSDLEGKLTLSVMYDDIRRFYL
ncbi:MAG: WG repeat-containing protein, partial [Bacteroidota bacterium]